MRRWSEQRKGFRLATGLLVVAVLPLMGMIASTVDEVIRADERARGAVVAEDAISRMAAGARLRYKIQIEQGTLLPLIEARRLGVTDDQLAVVLGRDFSAAIPETRRQVDDAVRQAEDAGLPSVASAVAELRRAVDAGTASSADVLTGYTAQIQRVWAVMDADLQEARISQLEMGDSTGEVDLVRRLDALRLSARAVDHALAELGMLYYEINPAAGGAGEFRYGLSGYRAVTLEALVDLRSRAEPGSRLGRALAAFDLDARVQRFETRVAATVRLSDPEPLTFDELVHLLPDGYVRSDRLYAAAQAAADDARQATRAQRVDAEVDRDQRFALMVALVAATLAAVALELRWMRRPLQRLEDRARAVSDGAVGLAPLPVRGPRETKVLASALNDVTATLDRVPRILDPDLWPTRTDVVDGIPGALGDSVRSAADRLHDALADLQRLALTDQLTGLGNRAALRQRLGTALGGHPDGAGAVAVLLIDLDGFKEVNDTLGHGFGDELLRRVAEDLRLLVRPADEVFRLGGDEFAVVLADITDVSEAVGVAGRVVRSLAAPFEIDAMRVQVSASVGVALAPPADVDVLLRNADLAMYAAKRAGKNQAVVFTGELYRAAARHARLRADLEGALERGELHLAYQSVHRCDSGAPVGVEALLRWTHRDDGPVSPAEFIPVAEESGLINQLGAWVVDEAVRQLAEWRARGEDLTVSVNVSPRQLLDHGFAEQVAAALSRHGVPARSLVVELTETMLISDPEQAAVSLERLRSLGMRIAIDDYGTGHASISYLRRLPVDVVKIDRSLVAGLTAPDGRDRALVRTVVDLARALDVGVTAEGVETVEQWEVLRELGVSHVQGFFFGRPVRPEELELGHAASA